MILTVLTTFFSYVITGNFRHNKPTNPVAVYLTSNYFLPKKYWTANNWHLDLLWTQWSLEIKSKSEHLAEFQRSDFHQSTLQIYSIIIISRNLHVRLLQENPSAIWLSANFSPVHTVSEAPLSSRERLSIIVAALGALKNSNIPLDIGQSGKCYWSLTAI